ncbi:trafficking PGA2-domain-containing protein [Rhexocercosporidium sp. MPI-PUGE-AT-0058]|nr:trafficking PGA2-domain-containing protein [Rhexocercosporidium sp. MPI-PUGE-AT-0058]
MDAFLSSAVEFFQWFISLPAQGYENLIRNSVHMWDDMSMLNYIRMIAIVGGYLFLRPYLQRWGERNQAKQHEKMLNEKEMQKKQGKEAKISPNALRGGGGKSVSFKEEESEEDKGKGEEWGKKAKKRQKKVVEILEEKKRVEEEEDDDKDIMEYLVDYEEGKDGW